MIKTSMLRFAVLGTVFGISIAILQGCAETTTDTTGGSPSGKTLNGEPLIGGTVYYTGYDGGINNFNLYVNTSRAITVHDANIATAQQVQLTIDPNTVANQVGQIEAAYIAAGETLSQRRRDRYERRFTNPRIWKIIPLKAGTTTFSAQSQRRNESIWEDAEIRTIVVSDYTASQLEAGRQRYEGITGNMACTNCHNTAFGSAAGAPPHLLGRVVEISDISVAQWISTGAVKDRIANIQHAWTFANDNEKFATVAYLRSKQTADDLDYARLLFEEELAETITELNAVQ